MSNGRNRDVVVIGGDIAGMQAALLLAEKDHRVHVLESEPAIGGFFALLDRQFPTNSCGVCFMSPRPPAYCPIYESEFHGNINLITDVDVTGLKGKAGDFHVVFRRRPRCVDPDKCTLCGKCGAVCPVEVASELGGGIEKRKAIYLPFVQAIPRAYLVGRDACTRCGKCVDVCEPGAINLDEEEVDDGLAAGAIVLGFGFEPFRGEHKGEYGLGRYANVVSSIQYERMLSYSGPTRGLPGRPSDGARPGKVAFIQCVGSRDAACGQGYCSSICCMYATKQAMITKERDPSVEAAVFYMDVRTMGKDYERYYERAKSQHGIRYLRSAVSVVRELQQTKTLRLTHGDDTGEMAEEEFDMVVLSLGFKAPQSVTRVAELLGVRLDEHGFCYTEEFSPTKTSVEGIYVAGAFREPRDIPETVVDASSAAADVSDLLDEFKPQADGQEEGAEAAAETASPDETQADEEPKVGVFVCDSKGMLAAGLDVDTVVADAAGPEQGVACVERVDVTSPSAGAAWIAEKIEADELDRAVLAGYHGLAVTKILKEQCPAVREGRCRVLYASIGEQCASVHAQDRAAATLKAKGLVRAAVRKARLSLDRRAGRKRVCARVLVVGGGVSGLSAAVGLAEQGLPVTLVETSADLGGNARDARYTLKGSEVPPLVEALVSRAEGHANIEVMKATSLLSLEGTWGNFKAGVGQPEPAGQADADEQEPAEEGAASDGSRKSSIACGAVIFATGAQAVVPDEYLYGRDERVFTQRQFETMLSECGIRNAARGMEGHAPSSERRVPRSVVMIQCVGSRDENRPYCSRVCCTHATKNVLKLQELNPDAEIYVLYRDMRTYGFYEDAYHQARKQGAVFVRYSPDGKPRVSSENGKLTVSFRDEVARDDVTVEADCLVLSSGIEPRADSANLARTAGLELTEDGFFAEANPKSAPLDCLDRGKYICGLCNAPNHIEDALAQGKAAAARASALLWQGVGEYADNQAYVNERRCSGCGLCVTACPYDARVLDPVSGTARVLDDLCKGCGTCVITCPNSASQQDGFERQTVLEVLDEVLE